MANEVEICNLALVVRLGANRIQSLTAEQTREARACNAAFSIIRDSVLREIDWSCVRKQKVLTLLTETVSGFDYVYDYPTDCLEAREIYNSAKASDNDLIPFRVGINDANNKKTILTDQEQAELIYTIAATNTAVFDASLVDVLSWRLAAELAVPLRGSTSLRESLYRTYLVELSKAARISKNEYAHKPKGKSSYEEARE